MQNKHFNANVTMWVQVKILKTNKQKMCRTGMKINIQKLNVGNGIKRSYFKTFAARFRWYTALSCDLNRVVEVQQMSRIKFAM